MSVLRRHRRKSRSFRPIQIEVLENRKLLSAGTLDTAFGSSGIVYGADNLTSDMVVQPDRKTVVAAGLDLYRYNERGNRDLTFSADGRIDDVPATAVAIQADVRLLVSGDLQSNDNVFHLSRYNSDGSLDRFFGIAGHAAADFGPPGELITGTEAYDIVVAPDGKIIAAGNTSSADANSFVFAAARFNSDGSLDKTFGGDGTITTTLSAPYADVVQVALQSDGKILLGGESGSAGSMSPYIVRLNRDGSLDSTFDQDGILKVNDARYDRTVGLAQQGNKIVYATFFGVGRLNNDGSPDTSFASNGLESFGRSFYDQLTHLALQSDGKILALGNIINGENFREGILFRLLPNGQHDTSFSSSGYSTRVRLDRQTDAQRVVLDADKKIIVGGWADDPTRFRPDHIGLARFLGDSAGGGGTTQTPFKGSPFNVGQTIQAEDFDNGGEGVAYHDRDATNNGGLYRNTGVDIEENRDITEFGYDVGWTNPGEWLEYTVNVPATGLYFITTRLASPKSGGVFHYELDGKNVSGPISIPNTGGFQTYTDLRTDNVSLPAGAHVLRLSLDTRTQGGGMANFNFLRFNGPNQSEGEPGLTATYFDNMDLTNPKLTRTDYDIISNWGAGSPDRSIGPDTFSVRWTGKIIAEGTDTYTFYSRTDDGVRLWVNNKLIIDHWTPQAATEWSGSIALMAGNRYDIKMEYFERAGNALAELSWKNSTMLKTIVPHPNLRAY